MNQSADPFVPSMIVSRDIGCICHRCGDGFVVHLLDGQEVPRFCVMCIEEMTDDE